MTEKAILSVKIPVTLKKQLEKEADQRELNVTDIVIERLSGPPGQSAPKADPSGGVSKPSGAPSQSDSEAITTGRTPAVSDDLSLYDDAELLRVLKIRKDKRDQENHEIDLKLKKVKLLKSSPQSRDVPCPIGGCVADKQGLTFRNQEELNEHYYMAHRDKLAERNGVEVGKLR